MQTACIQKLSVKSNHQDFNFMMSQQRSQSPTHLNLPSNTMLSIFFYLLFIVYLLKILRRDVKLHFIGS